ncbi:hypothetical protein SAMN05421779_10295 [Insolitispirillum peregrinum]|uniref:Uncharacterized protein n=1 Tax=Insolitispirillum peregrinum TaxID=80876 RepID=A0A1N7JCG1_9PROT|nr:hypothetical protein SAMN05421779_10295 [Insolitispirillum peregrinum]
MLRLQQFWPISGNAAENMALSTSLKGWFGEVFLFLPKICRQAGPLGAACQKTAGYNRPA